MNFNLRRGAAVLAAGASFLVAPVCAGAYGTTPPIVLAATTSGGITAVTFAVYERGVGISYSIEAARYPAGKTSSGYYVTPAQRATNLPYNTATGPRQTVFWRLPPGKYVVHAVENYTGAYASSQLAEAQAVCQITGCLPSLPSGAFQTRLLWSSPMVFTVSASKKTR